MQNNMILVADNDQSIRELLEFNLKEAGFEAVTVDNGKDAESVARCDHPELILMDMTMPVMDGVEACKILKGSPDTSDIPIIMLSARNDDADKVLSLELGADDYVTKPFSMRDLHARVRALLSETVVDLPEETVIEYGPFKINMDRFEAHHYKENMGLTKKELELLRMLMENQDRVLTRDFLLDRVWGYEYCTDPRTVDVHIGHLRHKMGNDANYIQTIRGLGYKWTTPSW